MNVIMERGIRPREQVLLGCSPPSETMETVRSHSLLSAQIGPSIGGRLGSLL